MGRKRRCYYEVLGLPKSSTKAEVRKAYLMMVKIHHPDQGGEKEAFMEVKEAYSVLSNGQRRQHYDKTGLVDDEMDEGYLRHCEKERLWALKMKERQERDHLGMMKNLQDLQDQLGDRFEGGGIRRNMSHEGDGFFFYDVDAWERGHGLGAYGNGPEAQLSYRKFYIDKSKEELRKERRKAEEERMSSHERFFRRRNERRGEHDFHTVANRFVPNFQSTNSHRQKTLGAMILRVARRVCI